MTTHTFTVMQDIALKPFVSHNTMYVNIFKANSSSCSSSSSSTASSIDTKADSDSGYDKTPMAGVLVKLQDEIDDQLHGLSHICSWQNPYEEKCRRQFRTLKGLKMHISAEHSIEPRLFSCCCGNTYRQLRSLRKHAVSRGCLLPKHHRASRPAKNKKTAFG